MSTERENIEAWCRVLFEEALFRAAVAVGESGPTPGRSVPVSLPITVEVDQEHQELVLTLDSAPDGPVTLRLAHPFGSLDPTPS